jgi:hypothetical protein
MRARRLHQRLLAATFPAIGSPASFLGRPIDPSSVLFRYTRYGDANLDGVVNLADFGRLAANFNTVGPWSSGNFDFDATTGIADFALSAGNVTLSVPADLPRAGVPEPVPACTAACLLAIRRRRTIV